MSRLRALQVMNYTTGYGRGGKDAKNMKNEVTISDLSGQGFRCVDLHSCVLVPET